MIWHLAEVWEVEEEDEMLFYKDVTACGRNINQQDIRVTHIPELVNCKCCKRTKKYEKVKRQFTNKG